MIKRNLLANYLGQGWTTLVGLAFVPLYIKYLGIEAFGLIGLFAMLNVWLSLLDMGLTPMLSREMARYSGRSHTAESIRDLLRTVEILTSGIGILIAGGIASVSAWIAGTWLQADALALDDVTQALAIMGLVTALRLVENVYRSSIIGLQRQVLFNVVTGGLATLRAAGAVAIIAWVSPTIQAFFIWQGLMSLVTLAILAATTYATLPKAGRAARFSLTSLHAVWRFAGGVFGITLLSVLLMQVDKVLLSRLLPLSDFGLYTLATVVAGAILTLVVPITQAWYPKLCELYARGDQPALADIYHKGAQLVSVTAGSGAVVLALFAETFLHLWTQDVELARRVAPLLSLLVLGNLLNGLMWMPYHVQLAHGWTSLTINMNIVAVVIIVPAIVWATPRYGAVGAAWVWVGLNTAYVFVGVHLMFRQILLAEKYRWYISDLLLPLGMALSAGIAVKVLVGSPEGALQQLAVLSIATIATIAAASMSSSHIRQQLQQTIGWPREHSARNE